MVGPDLQAPMDVYVQLEGKREGNEKMDTREGGGGWGRVGERSRDNKNDCAFLQAFTIMSTNIYRHLKWLNYCVS